MSDRLEVLLDEARALLPRIEDGGDRDAARELAELALVIGDAELVELVAGLTTALDRHVRPHRVAALVRHKLLAITLPQHPASSWDPVELAELRQLFLVEARASLSAMEDSYRALQGEPTAQAPFDALFRKAHTLKGSAGSVELHALSSAAHRLEEVLTAARHERDESLVLAIGAAMPELRRLVVGHPAVAAGPLVTTPLDALRVDELLDASSELVLDRTRIERRLRRVEELAGNADAPLRAQLAELEKDVATLARTTRRLGERLRRLRAVEFSVLTAQLEPVARAAAVRERKEVQVVTRGASEEIDQRLADALVEPLLHLLRNAVAHGVETPAQRALAGKSGVATVTLTLVPTGDGLELGITDDGPGVDLDAVRAALVASERLTEDEARSLSEQALLATLFQAGISTRALSDDLAGRGVGLDVVADAIARLGGDVAVNTQRGRGTHFSIRVPVESRVLEALLFKVGDQVFAVPSARVEEVAEEHEGAADPLAATLRIGDEELELVRLGSLLRLPPPPGNGERPNVVVLNARDKRFAVTCDRIIGPRDIVVRRLPPALVGARPWAGATISGAGKVQLIFDVDALALLGAQSAARPSYPLGPRRVLVADEARSLREAVALVLEHAGYAVERAPDGWEALELLGDRPFDLVVFRLADAGLPAARFVERVRAISHLRGVPLVALGERVALTAGVVPLPLRRRPLLDVVEQVLRSRR